MKEKGVKKTLPQYWKLKEPPSIIFLRKKPILSRTRIMV